MPSHDAMRAPRAAFWSPDATPDVSADAAVACVAAADADPPRIVESRRVLEKVDGVSSD